MAARLKNIWNFIREAGERFIDDKAPKLGAALSFYTIFSLAPFLMLIIAIAGLIFGEDAAQGRVINELQDFIGKEGAVIIQTALKNVSYESNGIIAIIISVVTILIGSTVVFSDVQESLNMIWGVKARPGRGIIKGFLTDRLLSFIMVPSAGFLLFLTLLLSAVISSINDFISQEFFSVPILFLQILNLIISFLIIFALFMIIFKFLPNVKVRWKYVWVGAFVTSILFLIGQYLIGLYLGRSSLSSTYGAAGSLVVLLLWIYYSSQILFFGAEIIHVYADIDGEGIKPHDNFMKIEEYNNIPGK